MTTATSARATSTTGRRNFCKRFLMLGTLTPAVAHAQKPTHDVMLATGQLNAVEHEARDGYFAVGQGMALHVKPGTVPHDLLKANNYSHGDLIWRVRG